MSSKRFQTGFGKFLVYLQIILHIPCHYLRRPGLFSSPAAYLRFLCRALRLLLIFRHNKVVRTAAGWKLHLYLPAYPAPAFFHALESKLLMTPPGATTLVFSMTKACSYRCRHCYQRNDPATDIDEELLLSTAQAAVDHGVAMLDIEGGEPFMRYPRLLRLLQALDSRCEKWVNTNGAGLTPERLLELRSAGLAGLMVSVHSPDSSIHDAFTEVPGSFEAACTAVKACRQAGLMAVLNSVLSEHELRAGALPRLMDLAREFDCDYVQLIHPKPAGRWLGQREGMQTDPALIRQVQAAHRLYNSPARHEYPSLAAQVFEESPGVLGCTAGAVDRYYIGSSGEVQPCEFLNISFGNVRDEPFPEIYARMRSYFRMPCQDWLCCTQADAIQQLYHEHNLQQTPLPWAVTRELVENWRRGQPTEIYKKLKIYR